MDDTSPRSDGAVRPMKVAIYGAGVAGLATAAALQADGHHCQVHERCAARLDSGMAFILMPEALDGLRQLGVAAAQLPGAALGHYLHRDQHGRVLARHALPSGVLCLQRRHLLQALLGRLSPAPALHLDSRLCGLDFDADGQLRCGWATQGARTVVDITADLHVAADGHRSLARQALHPHWPSRPARVQEIVGLLHDADLVRWCGSDFNKFHALRGGTAFGLLPTGGDALVWYLQFDARLLPAGQRPSTPELQALVQACTAGWDEPVAHALARANCAQACLWRPIDADCPPAFHRGNLVLVGDAAHPLLPFSSQGVSSALLDAVALARLLRHAPAMDEALQRYSRERRAACLPHVARGREITDRFFEPAGGGGIPMAMASAMALPGTTPC